MVDEEERKYRCTECGRIGTVGRCCGRNTLVAICKENSVKDIDLSDLANFPVIEGTAAMSAEEVAEQNEADRIEAEMRLLARTRKTSSR